MGFVPSKALPNMCVKKHCPHDYFPCAGFLCIPNENGEAGEHLVCLTFLIQMAMNFAIDAKKIGEFWKASYETRLKGDPLKILEPLKHSDPANPGPMNYIDQTLNNLYEYGRPSANDLADTLLELSGMGGADGPLDVNDLIETNGQDDNSIGKIIVMTHVATSIA